MNFIVTAVLPKSVAIEVACTVRPKPHCQDVCRKCLFPQCYTMRRQVHLHSHLLSPLPDLYYCLLAYSSSGLRFKMVQRRSRRLHRQAGRHRHKFGLPARCPPPSLLLRQAPLLCRPRLESLPCPARQPAAGEVAPWLPAVRPGCPAAPSALSSEVLWTRVIFSHLKRTGDEVARVQPHQVKLRRLEWCAVRV